MSWCYTINGAVEDFVLPEKLVEDMMTVHPMYGHDMLLALEIAQRSGFKSCVCTGFRTANPYGSDLDEVCEITVRGTSVPVDMYDMVRRAIQNGPDKASD